MMIQNIDIFEKSLVLIGSARHGGNTENYINSLFENVDTQKVNLLDYKIAEFNYDYLYPNTDQFQDIVEMIINHRKIVFVTPVYWYSMSGVMKNLFDRFTDLVTIRKDQGRSLAGKSVYLIAIGTDSELPGGFEVPFDLTAKYFDMIFEGTIYHSVRG